jgi:poly(A) polymerase
LSQAREFASDVVRTLRDQGHQAYLVGGCVRDLLLGREPADYDIATDAPPDRVMQIFPQTFAVGAQFGVVLIPLPKEAEQQLQNAEDAGDAENIKNQESEIKNSLRPLRFEVAEEHPIVFGHHHAVEVATFRCDVGYTDGRHPDAVRYSSSAQEDVQRRDFTINGLLLDPVTNEVLDYVGGRADLAAGIIRAIGDPERRFAEDKLRMLRAVRFAARFGYSIDPQTFAAIQRLAAEIHQVSHERVRDELIKMLTEGRARRAFELLAESRLLEEVLPEVAAMQGVEQPPQFHPEGDVWFHTLLLLEQLSAGASPTLALGALLHDVGKPPTFTRAPDRIRFDGHVEVGEKIAREICRRLRLSNDDAEQVLALVANHMRFADVERMKDSTFKRFVRLPRFDEHLRLHAMDVRASHGDVSLLHFTEQRLAAMPPEAVRPHPLINGRDLIAAGFQPGPIFSEILTTVEDAQLEGRLHSREEALAFVEQEFGSRRQPA